MAEFEAERAADAASQANAPSTTITFPPYTPPKPAPPFIRLTPKDAERETGPILAEDFNPTSLDTRSAKRADTREWHEQEVTGAQAVEIAAAVSAAVWLALTTIMLLLVFRRRIVLAIRRTLARVLGRAGQAIAPPEI